MSVINILKMEFKEEYKLLNEELEEQRYKTQELANEREAKLNELASNQKKVAELKKWLDTLLKSNEGSIDIIPQVRAGIAEIEELRERNYQYRKQLAIEKKRVNSLKQDHFRIKKRVKEQQIELNDIEKGVLVLEKESLANNIRNLSSELDQLSTKNTLYKRVAKENDMELNSRFQNSVKTLMKLKSEYAQLMVNLIFNDSKKQLMQETGTKPRFVCLVKCRTSKTVQCQLGCGGSGSVDELKESEVEVDAVTLKELKAFNSNLLEADKEDFALTEDYL